jgi:hypothetical protein
MGSRYRADRLAGELGMRTYHGAENCGALAILDAARVEGAVADFYAAAQARPRLSSGSRAA